MSSRRTLAGDTLRPATTANVTLIAPVGRAFELMGTAQSLQRAVCRPGLGPAPAGRIAQNGRTLRVGLRWTLGAKE